MKLKSYFNPTRDSNLMQDVQVRLAADAAPASPYVALGEIDHDIDDDNLSGAQNTNISHVVFQHVQEALYKQHGIQDMQRIRITFGGGYVALKRVLIDQGANRLGYNEETTITVSLDPVNATHDPITFEVSNPDLVEILADDGDGVFTFRGPGKGEFFVTVRVGEAYEQTFPYEISEELPAVPDEVYITALAIAPATVTLTAAAPTQQLTVTITPDDATNKTLTYTSSDPTKATVSSTGLVTRVANGTTTITVKATDVNGVQATRSVTVTD